MVAERLVVYAPAGGALSRIKQGHSLPGAFIFEKTKNEAKRTCLSGGVTFQTRKVTKSVFAANQPCGFLRNFESARASGPRKQPSMADSALYAIHGAPTHLHEHSQN